MQNSVENLYKAVFTRRSRRQFNGMNLPAETAEKLMQFTAELNERIQGARVVMVTQNPDKAFKGVIGAYGKVKGAPAYAAFIGDMKDARVQEKTGIIGEYFILEATSLGLATCWVGGFFNRSSVREHVGLEKNEEVLAITPIGFADENYTLEEKIMSGFAKTHKRKNMEELLLAVPEGPIPQWINNALEVARLAPSALNRQPWRFSVEGETIKISLDSEKDPFHVSKRLDFGIAMAHIEIAAGNAGIEGCWEYLTGRDVARFSPVG